MLDLNRLMQPIRDDAPGGDDLEYDDAFIALEMASKPSEERVIGDNVIPAEDPDYDDVAVQAAALLERTQDLRVAAILANAQARISGLSGVRDLLRYVEGCLQTHWDSVHPQLDEDDGDPTMRVNAVLAFASRDGLLRSLRHAPLVDSRAFGTFSLRDMEVASGDALPLANATKVVETQSISAAFQDADQEDVAQTLTAATEALEAVRAIGGVFDNKVGAAGPDLDPLEKILGDICRRLGAFVDAGAASEEPSQVSVDPASAPQGSVSNNAAITTPQDVKAALDRIMAYYARFEPSSPLPILLARAKRLVSADFVTIMKDMAPEGVGNVALIGGFEPDEGDEGTY
ncbi:type VI secretion system protein TssA [uncultured Tateyamaria sp.]|uniref:type VI secretion system protein TssA n=1 Tax=uncultured Tateyamaria sp. TaxID=455651 RepID=UPI00261F623C|nr:type VI secretion system protein TssA [uncultured Tateyamaria sp.]